MSVQMADGGEEGEGMYGFERPMKGECKRVGGKEKVRKKINDKPRRSDQEGEEKDETLCGKDVVQSTLAGANNVRGEKVRLH